MPRVIFEWIFFPHYACHVPSAPSGNSGGPSPRPSRASATANKLTTAITLWLSRVPGFANAFAHSSNRTASLCRWAAVQFVRFQVLPGGVPDGSRAALVMRRAPPRPRSAHTHLDTPPLLLAQRQPYRGYRVLHTEVR